ncbi:hypothetical protein MNEG_8544 [Monoraphidium neglectum]|uniref:LisH domain-containing protein n=1 Tax=Monoraphidium neglectum TaxID=145388 RepID=A0A0D2MZ44_9CHLO|nr:hypothetical protein MNEG_8544 [Monoraphidium neglectum]KIY99420.1 hypothetical protein MNEG_8544 [Monoraphidium neglectum]|eukprot:XP_013898440.1 hypothetical protein MNEG_8544 [Monoraphidium neglectum]
MDHMPPISVEEHGDGAVQPNEAFKEQLYSQLKRSGVVSTLKAQLRAQLLAQLQPGARAAPGALLVAAPARDQFALPTSLTQQQQQQQRPSRNGTRLWRAAMDALVADHLAACGRACSLSVFAAEAHLPDHGSSGGGALGRDDLLVLLRLAERHPAVHGELRRLAADEDGAGSLGASLLEALAAADSSAAAGRQAGPPDTPPLQQPQPPAQQPALPEAPLTVAGQLRAVEEAHARRRGRGPAQGAHQPADGNSNGGGGDGDWGLPIEERMARYRQERLRRQQREVEAAASEARRRLLSEEQRIEALRSEVAASLERRERGVEAGEAALAEARCLLQGGCAVCVCV